MMSSEDRGAPERRAPILPVTKDFPIGGIDSFFRSEADMIDLGVMLAAMALVTVLLPRSGLFER